MKKLLIILMALLLCSTALAKTVTINDAEVSVPFTVKNDTAQPQDLSVNVIVPSAYGLSELPAQLPPNEEFDFELILMHDEELIGDTYTGKVIMTVGQNTTTEELRIEFNELAPVEAEDETEDQAETEVDEPMEMPDETEAEDENAEMTQLQEEMGLASATGFLSLAVFSPATLELTLDIVLFIVVVILFIAFISRFIKRLEARSVK